MAQDNHSNPPPAASSDSMSPGKDSNGRDRSESSSRLVVNGGINKGKGVIKTEAEEDCRSTGKNITPQVIAAAPSPRDGRSGGRRGDRELHVVTERLRRKRISEMFTNLHGLLPTLPEKVDKSSLVMETIHYIKSLEGTVIELEKRKLEMELARGKPGAAANGGVSLAPPVTLATPLAGLSAGGIWPTVMAPAPAVALGAMTAAPAPAVALGAMTAAPAPVGLQTWSGPNVVLSQSGNNAYINISVPRSSGVLTLVLAVLEKHDIDVMTTTISSDHSKCMFTIHARINGVSTQFGDHVTSDEIYKLALSEIMVWLSE